MSKKIPPVPFERSQFSSSDKTIVKKDWAALLEDMNWVRGLGSTITNLWATKKSLETF
jgi:hypothetical protein